MMMAFRVAILMAAGAAAGLTTAWGQVKSGIFGNLTIGVDGTALTGVFSDARPGNGTEEAPQFSCLFLLSGSVSGAVTGTEDAPIAVTVWSPPDKATSAGTLTVKNGTAKLHLEGDPPGCAATGDEFVSKPYEDTLVADGKWTSVRLVSADSAIVRQAPLSGSSEKATLKKGDVVVIYRRIGAWLDGRDPNGTRAGRGWIRDGDLAPDHP